MANETMLEIDVHPYGPDGNFYGYATVTTAGFTMEGFRIMSNQNGELFVAMPSRQDSKSETGYRNTVYLRDPGQRSEFSALVLEKYLEEIEKPQNSPKREGGSFSVAKGKAEAYNNEAQEPEKKKPSGKEAR